MEIHVFRKKFFNGNQRFSNVSTFFGAKATFEQGCQIFLGTKYQNGKKYTKLLRTLPIVYKI
jgi:hypothetical protein